MKRMTIRARLSAATVMFLFTLTAWATWDGQVVVSGASVEDLQSSTISFESNGQSLPVEVEEDRDGNAVLIIGFSGNSATPGTLTIAGSDGTQSINTPAAGPGQNIYVDTTGPGSASTLRPASTVNVPLDIYFPRHQIGVSLGIQNLQGDDIATSSTTLPAGPGSEFPTLSAEYDVDAVGGSISYAYNTGGSLPSFLDWTGFSSNLTIGGSYSTYSDDDSSSAISNELIDRGFLYTLLAPAPNDFTGPFFGQTEAQSFADVDVDFDSFEAFLEWLCGRDAPGDSFYKSRLDVRYTQWDVEVDSIDTFDPPFPASGAFETFNHRAQSVDQDIIELGLGTQLINPLSNGWDVYGGGAVRVYYSDADLRSVETSAVNGTPDVRRVDQSDDEWDIGLDLTAGIGYNFARNWRASADATVQLNVPSASIDNPVRGDGSNPGATDLSLTRINYDSETRYNFGLNIRYAFE